MQLTHVSARTGRDIHVPSFGRYRETLSLAAKFVALTHNHDENPTDDSNWERLCLYCQDNEYQRQLDTGPVAVATAPPAPRTRPLPTPPHS
jgi:hypothetical protein